MAGPLILHTHRSGALCLGRAPRWSTPVQTANAALIRDCYASTVHAAQGITTDVFHGIVTGAEYRQLLYPMLT